jgi:hypothetical protein
MKTGETGEEGQEIVFQIKSVGDKLILRESCLKKIDYPG